MLEKETKKKKKVEKSSATGVGEKQCPKNDRTVPHHVQNLINNAGFKLTNKDLGVYIDYATDDAIHDALDVPHHVPLPHGLSRQGTPAQSAQLLRDW